MVLMVLVNGEEGRHTLVMVIVRLMIMIMMVYNSEGDEYPCRTEDILCTN